MHKEYCAIGYDQDGEKTVIEAEHIDIVRDIAHQRKLTGLRIMGTTTSREAISMIIKRLKTARDNAEIADDRAYSNGTIGRIDSQIAHYEGLFKDAKWTIADLEDRGYEIFFNRDREHWICYKDDEEFDYDKCISVLLSRVNEKLTDYRL